MAVNLSLAFSSESQIVQPFYLNILLGTYMFSYIFLICALILFFSMLLENYNASLGFKAVLAAAIKSRLRWLLIFLFTSMAALPPSFFFFSKLSLLSSVVNYGGWFIFGLFLGYVLLSWSIYYAVIRYALFSAQIPTSLGLSKQRLSAKNAQLAIFLLCMLFLSSFFFEDMYFLVYWVLV